MIQAFLWKNVLAGYGLGEVGVLTFQANFAEVARMSGAVAETASSHQGTLKDMRQITDESNAGKAMQASILELEQQMTAKDWLLVQLQVLPLCLCSFTACKFFLLCSQTSKQHPCPVPQCQGSMTDRCWTFQSKASN